VRIFLAGASGVIGRHLVALLVADGHEVAGMTRTPGKVDQLRRLGAEPVVCDVFDREALSEVVGRFALLHALDRPELAESLERAAGEDLDGRDGIGRPGGAAVARPEGEGQAGTDDTGEEGGDGGGQCSSGL
jgi:uncharacterized protein YbjT (DUF2867 family)